MSRITPGPVNIESAPSAQDSTCHGPTPRLAHARTLRKVSAVGTALALCGALVGCGATAQPQRVRPNSPAPQRSETKQFRQTPPSRPQPAAPVADNPKSCFAALRPEERMFGTAVAASTSSAAESWRALMRLGVSSRCGAPQERRAAEYEAAAALASVFDASSAALLATDAPLREQNERLERITRASSIPAASLRNGILLGLGKAFTDGVCADPRQRDVLAATTLALVSSPESTYQIWWEALLSPVDISLRAQQADTFWPAQSNLMQRMEGLVARKGRGKRTSDALAAANVSVNPGRIPLSCESTARVVSDRGVVGAENGQLDAGESVVLALTCRNNGSARLMSESLTPIASTDSCVIGLPSEIVLPEIPAGGTADVELGPFFVSSTCESGTPLRFNLSSSRYPGGGTVLLALNPRSVAFNITGMQIELDDPGHSTQAPSLAPMTQAEFLVNGRMTPGYRGQLDIAASATALGNTLYRTFEVDTTEPLRVSANGDFVLGDDIDVTMASKSIILTALAPALAQCSTAPADLREQDNWLAFNFSLESVSFADPLARLQESAPEFAAAALAMRRAQPEMGVREVLTLLARARAQFQSQTPEGRESPEQRSARATDFAAKWISENGSRKTISVAILAPAIALPEAELEGLDAQSSPTHNFRRFIRHSVSPE